VPDRAPQILIDQAVREVREPLALVDGALAVPSGPGLGIDLDDGLVERMRVE
jgi:L-alanine-DL-glutamate epimerase-like enolase superfamily enzyme